MTRAAALLAAIALCTPAAEVNVATPPLPNRAAIARERSASRIVAEHRYRIVGRVRLALFWFSRDDVGGARLTWRSDGRGTVLALLAGSDPARAPRGLNQWVYVREETHTDDADVFTLRSLNDDGGAPDAPLDAGNGPLFGASCASMTQQRVSSAATTVAAHDATYRMFDRVLDRLAASADWTSRESGRPAGADAGFLSALRHVVDLDDGSPLAPARATYVYNSTIYDLTARRRHPLGRTEIGGRTFDRLNRADCAVRNRTTGDVTSFSVTYAPGLSLPVQIFYQPSFWIRIELRLDDRADVPADPAGDAAVLERLRAICHAAGPAASDR